MESAPAPVSIETLLAHREWVRRVALVLVRDDRLAADLEQDLWVKVLENPPMVRGSLRGWLAAALRNDFLNRRRGDVRRAARERSTSRPEAVASAADLVADAEALRRVVNAVMDLAEPYRTTILHRYYEDLSPGEIAARQSVPVETVRTRLKRAVALLREAFDGEARGDRAAWCLALVPLTGRPAAVVSPATGAFTLGGILMAHKAPAAVAAVVLLAGAGWLALRPGSPVPGPVPAAPIASDVSRAPKPAAPSASPAAPPVAEAAGGEFPPPVDLSRCDRDLDLFGVVVDGQAAPVPGATVQVETYPWQAVHTMNRERYYDMVPGPGTRTSVDGSFRVRLRRGDAVGLRIRKEGLAERFLTPVLAGERMRIVLARGADLAVTVLDEAGAPVPGARLRLWRFTPSWGREIERAGATDDAGRFVFDALSPGKATLSVDAEGRPLPGWFQPDIQAGKTVSIEVRLPAARIVEGTVTDATTGEPVAGARVGIGWTMEHAVVTGKDGRYRMGTWAPKQGRLDLHARAAGYAGLGIDVPGEGRLDFPLRPGDSVTGRLLDPAGRPVAGAMVSVWPPDTRAPPPPGPQSFDYAAGTSGTDGRFLLRGLEHGLPFHALAATGEGLGRLVVEFAPAAEEGGVVDLGDLAFPVARAIEGVVIGPDGGPAAGVGVVAKGVFPDRGRTMPGGALVSESADRGNMSIVRTDDLGRFRFPGLSAGPWNLSAAIEGAPRLEKTVVLPPDRDVLDVRLGGAATGATTLTVFVLTETGEPVEGVVVYLSPEGKGALQKTSNARGLVLFQGLAPRPHDLQVPDYGERMAGLIPPPMEKVTPAGQEIRVILREAAEVRGVVVDAAGTPLPRMLIFAYVEVDREGAPGLDPKGLLSASYADERGEFAMKGPRGSPLRLVVPGARAWPKDVDPRVAGAHEMTQVRGEVRRVVAPAVGIRITATVPRADRSLDLLLLDADGHPAAGIRVLLRTQPAREARTGSDGKAHFEGLLADRMQLMVLPEEGVALAEDAVPPAGQWVEPAGQSFTLRFTRGVSLKGRVLLPDGTPAAGARVIWFVPEKALNSGPVRTDGAGRFRVAVPPDERPHVSASLVAAEDSILSAFATSVDPAAGDLELRLHPPERK